MLLLAVSSLTFEGFEDTDYENLFLNAARLGYERVEFNCWHAKDLQPVQIRRLKRRCEESGLLPAALHVSGFGGSSPELLSLNTAHKIRAIEAAAELGCRRVVASAMDSCIQLDEIAGELECLIQTAEAADVLLCLENHCHTILAGERDYAWLLERADSGQIGICLDGGHLEAHGEEISGFVERFSGKINHIHLKENRIFGKKSFCRFGHGGTDNAAMLRQLAAKGYSGYMSAELSPEIGEDGNAAPFTDADRRKPLEMFKGMEQRRTGE